MGGEGLLAQGDAGARVVPGPRLTRIDAAEVDDGAREGAVLRVDARGVGVGPVAGRRRLRLVGQRLVDGAERLDARDLAPPADDAGDGAVILRAAIDFGRLPSRRWRLVTAGEAVRLLGGPVAG